MKIEAFSQFPCLNGLRLSKCWGCGFRSCL